MRERRNVVYWGQEMNPLGPHWEGAPAAAGGGESLAVIRNISGCGKVLSLRPCGATSLAEGGKKVVGKNFLNYTTPPCIL